MMTDVVAALRKEHSNISQLLDILDRQVALFAAHGEPDHDIVDGIVDYFQSYPYLYHHPKEDLVFQRLNLRDPLAAARMGDLQAEHEEIAKRTRRFAAAIRTAFVDPEPRRDTAIVRARAFMAHKRDHMAREERLLYAAAQAALRPDDWNDVVKRMTSHDDPLFGDEVGGRYESLRQDIVRSFGDMRRT